MGVLPDQGGEDGDVNDEPRALQLYERAMALVGAKGAFITIGLTRLMEYRAGSLIVRYQPTAGSLEVWFSGKVLGVKRHNDTLHVTSYRPGPWEQELEKAAK